MSIRLPIQHYVDERLRHQEQYDVIYPTPKEATKIIKKLRRHFKLSFDFSFPNVSRGMALRAWGRCYHIELPKKDISLGLICHEVAHALSMKKYKRPMHHNKRYQRQCDRVCKWASRYVPKKETTTPRQLVTEAIQECNC